MDYRLPRGTRDILPQQAALFRRIQDTAVALSDMYGYGEIHTPIFEYSELFQRGVGESTDIVEKEMYSFQDRGKRSLTLRPEGTAPIVRAFVEHKLYNEAMPARYYYWGPMFRYERPQAGRYRQFWQYGVELFGTLSPWADVEVIKLGWDFFIRLGIPNSLVVNNIGCGEDRANYKQSLKQHFANRPLCDDCNNRLVRNPLRLLDCKNPSCQQQMTDMPLIDQYICTECAQHFDAVLAGLEALGVPFERNPRLVRGLDYYNRTTFEYKTDKLGAQDALGGGGRYDGLVELLGGPSTPAVGFALGIDRLELLMSGKEDTAIRRGIWLVTMESVEDQAALWAYKLRDKGVSIEFDLLGRSIKAQFRQADRSNCRWALVLGPDELEKGKGAIRDLVTGQQEEVALDGLVEHILNLEGVKANGTDT